jgi:hypothetical protein
MDELLDDPPPGPPPPPAHAPHSQQKFIQPREAPTPPQAIGALDIVEIIH